MPSHNGASNYYCDTGSASSPLLSQNILSNAGGLTSREDQLSQVLVSSLVRQMSKPDSNLTALSWKRLHLSRAKLKASSRTSALLSGFAMVAMVELQVNNDSNAQNQVPTALLITFTVCTTLLVSVHMLALMISTCILPNVEAVASVHGLAPVSESPHEKMHFYIEIAWAFSTVFGIFLFLIELAILCWVKFWDIAGGKKAALAASIILVPIGMVFIGFAIHFYRTLVSHKFERSERGLQELESMASQLQNDNHEFQRNVNCNTTPSSMSPVINI